MKRSSFIENLPQSRTTYVFAFVAFVVFIFSLRWFFQYPDPSTFLIYVLVAGCFAVMAYLIETVDFLKKKCQNLDKRLDSHIYFEEKVE